MLECFVPVENWETPSHRLVQPQHARGVGLGDLDELPDVRLGLTHQRLVDAAQVAAEERVLDALVHDGLWCPFEQCSMGAQADDTAASRPPPTASMGRSDR